MSIICALPEGESHDVGDPGQGAAPEGENRDTGDSGQGMAENLRECRIYSFP